MNLNNFQHKELQQMEQEIGKYQYQPIINTVGSIDDVITLLMIQIEEKFEDIYVLYYYLTVQLRLQIQDAQIRTSVTNTHEKIIIINLGLHLKGANNKYLYGVIIMDDIMEQQHYKYLWQIDRLLSADQISTKYGLDIASLPTPSKISYSNNHLNKTDLARLINRYNYKHLTSNNGRQNGYKLVIDEAEWKQILKEELNNDDIPWIPVFINDNDDLQIAHIKIIHIPSKDVYVGIQLERSLLPKKLQTIFPPEIEQYINQYTEKLSIIRDPRTIIYASAAASLSGSISLLEMSRYTQKWVTDIKVDDLNKKLTNIADNRDVDPQHVMQSFAANNGRRGFSESMKQHGIKNGRALKIYNDIEKLGLISSASSDNIPLNDFSSHWEQVLQLQHGSQQEYLDHLVEELSKINSNNNDISISNNTFFEQSLPSSIQDVNEEMTDSDISNQIVQQMMHYFNQGMENMNMNINSNMNVYPQNNDNEEYMNYVSQTQEVPTYLY